ncbi:MAG: substrate-binding domain-containing protein [Rhizobiaceae bacterium]
MRNRPCWFAATVAFFVIVLANSAVAAAEMRMAVTTSFHNSGLSDQLLPEIKADIDLEVRLVVVGTGQALKLGRAGDVDAILVHSKQAEERFVVEGFGRHRREIMYNDFVLIGPSADPAGIALADNVTDALRKILSVEASFVSRGDDSGTHRKEQALWSAAGLATEALDPAWYRAVGSGMGATLNVASGMNAYVMSDRASWLKFKNKGDLSLLYSGDPGLFNQYAYLPINSKRHTHVKADAAAALEAWLTSEKGQGLIGRYVIDGERLFTPNAKK